MKSQFWKPCFTTLTKELFNFKFYCNPVNILERYFESINTLTNISSPKEQLYEITRVKFILFLISLRFIQVLIICFHASLMDDTSSTVWRLVNMDTMFLKQSSPHFNLLHVSIGIELLYYTYRMHFFDRSKLVPVIGLIEKLFKFKNGNNKNRLFLKDYIKIIEKGRAASMRYLESIKYFSLLLCKYRQTS